jgi:hypothetical protein
MPPATGPHPASARPARALAPLALALLLLAACSGPPDLERLTLDRIGTEAGSPYAVAYGAYIRGNAAVTVCGVPAPGALTVVRDADGAVVPEGERRGREVRFRVPDLGPDERACDVEVTQARVGGREAARLAGALPYRPWRPLAGKRVLMYASINAGDSDNNARARFASAVASVEAEQGLDLTVVDGDFDAYLDGDVALEFAARLAAESWDAVVFVEESYIIPTSVLVEVSTYLAARGGRALATYWATFEDGEFAAFGVPAGAVGGPARAFAAAFGAQVGPSDNVRPVVGGSIDVELHGGLGLGLDATYRLLNADHYVLSYAQRLTPIGPAESLCRYPDELGGSCAVGRAGTTLYLGFTLAPLSESMSGAELETLFRNAMTYVILDAE